MSVRVTPELYDRLTDAALAEGRSRSDIMRFGTDLFLRVLEQERAERGKSILRQLMSEAISPDWKERDE